MKMELFSLKKIFSVVIAISLSLTSCSKNSKQDTFTFVFMTDIHLTTERNAVPGFLQAIKAVNDLQRDFVITGGDLIMDALGQSYGKEILDLFKGYNLKLVLQGHLHTIEDIFIDGIHFLTGGAISAVWWTGPNRSFEEGFMLLSIKEYC